MTGQLGLALIAILLGAVAGVLLFVPFVAVSYRRHGGLSPTRATLWAAALVYGWAVWVYTLLPLPAPDSIACVGYNTDPLQFVTDLSAAVTRDGMSLRALATDSLVLQLALNVLLFMPLGFFVRVLGRRGVVTAAVCGLVLSAIIETTQLTGVWGLYSCAFRVFDVDDMLTNTVGAVLGSLVALLVRARAPWEAVDVEALASRPVSKTRRLIGMLCDWFGLTLTTFAATVAVRAFILFQFGHEALLRNDSLTSRLGTTVALVLWLGYTVVSGTTVGDAAVQIRYTRARLGGRRAALVRFAAGIGGYGLLELLPQPWTIFATLFAAAAVVFALATTSGRGLPGVVLGARVVGTPRTGRVRRRERAGA